MGVKSKFFSSINSGVNGEQVMTGTLCTDKNATKMEESKLETVGDIVKNDLMSQQTVLRILIEHSKLILRILPCTIWAVQTQFFAKIMNGSFDIIIKLLLFYKFIIKMYNE